MRDAAADLEFEEAAQLRDEIKRLRETELAVMDDPLARDVAVSGGGSRVQGAETAWPKGKARARGKSRGGKPGGQGRIGGRRGDREITSNYLRIFRKNAYPQTFGANLRENAIELQQQEKVAMSDAIRVTETGFLDEIVASGGAHMENMGRNKWWICFTLSDGRKIGMNFTSKDLHKAAREEYA